MDPRFEVLRNAIYATQDEFVRLYQLIVNVVLATDIGDKMLRESRHERFVKAHDGQPSEFKSNLKATVGVEYMMQACDVIHTMRAWPIYREWNSKLFAEMYKAYKEGRAEKDPSEFWYNVSELIVSNL